MLSVIAAQNRNSPAGRPEMRAQTQLLRIEFLILLAVAMTFNFVI